jgi:septal ring factor EnvC (AmiA/AmiB activator)
MIRLLAALLVLAGAAVAQEDPATAAAAAKSRLDAAAQSLTQADGARDRVAALTETVRAYEDGLVAMRDSQRRAAIRATSITAELDAKSASISQLLGVLESMGRAPAPLLLLHPSGPIGTARSGMIAAEVTPALQAEADNLRARLEELAVLRSLQESAATTLAEGLQGAQDARAALSHAISERTDLPLRFEEDPVQTALLIASTETLGAFATGLAETFPQNGANTDVPTDKRGFALPVQGPIVRRYNAPDAAGIARPGIIIAARPRSLITTPITATVLFRGPLLDYGNVIILEPAADVMFIFAGLAEVYGEPGQVLPAGSPLGLMGGEQPSSDGNLKQSTGNDGNAASETLYLEVREGQSPVDPATWFALD